MLFWLKRKIGSKKRLPFLSCLIGFHFQGIQTFERDFTKFVFYFWSDVVILLWNRWDEMGFSGPFLNPSIRLFSCSRLDSRKFRGLKQKSSARKILLIPNEIKSLKFMTLIIQSKVSFRVRDSFAYNFVNFKQFKIVASTEKKSS